MNLSTPFVNLSAQQCESQQLAPQELAPRRLRDCTASGEGQGSGCDVASAKSSAVLGPKLQDAQTALLPSPQGRMFLFTGCGLASWTARSCRQRRRPRGRWGTRSRTAGSRRLHRTHRPMPVPSKPHILFENSRGDPSCLASTGTPAE